MRAIFDGYRELTTYDLVTYGTSGKACYGNSSSGDGYSNSCIHSGVITASGDLPTTWYNYALASAGTITGTSNGNPAMESICPKGWAMPGLTRIRSLTGGSGGSSAEYVPVFNPVRGGVLLYDSNTSTNFGVWWGRDAYNGNDSKRRNFLIYQNSLSQYAYLRRFVGTYIRCVQSS